MVGGESLVPRWLRELFPIKTVALVLLVGQSTSLILSMRYSRTRQVESMYLSTVAVMLMELLKMTLCVAYIFFESGFKNAPKVIWDQVFGSELVATVKLVLPAVAYTVQNILLFIALSNLDAPLYQVTYQLKVVTVVLFSKILLGKSYSGQKWAAVFLLMAGIAIVQLSTTGPDSKPKDGQSVILGLTCVLLACCTSGFAGIYIEWMMKGREGDPPRPPTSLAIFNIRLSIWAFLVGVGAVYWEDGARVWEGGLLQGFDSVVWSIVLNQALGGLVVAAVIKYADNVLKGFAFAISIVLSTMAAGVFQAYAISMQFVIGAFLVIAATIIYALPDEPQSTLPKLVREGNAKV